MEEDDFFGDRDKLKRKLHADGIPAGFGMPDQTPTPEEQEEMRWRAQMEDDAANMAAQQAMGQYRQTVAPGDKARIIQYVHTNRPFERDANNNIIKGDVDEGVFFDYWGWLTHNASLSNLDPVAIGVEEVNLEINALKDRMSKPRTQYTPIHSAQIENMKHLAKLKLHMNKDGWSSYLAHAEVIEDLRAFKIMRNRPGKWDKLKAAASGRGE